MQKIKTEVIEGRVARILNERELVINRGTEQGIQDGMKFSILEEANDIIDPETSEVLGSLTREKIRVKIVDVQPRFSVGRTYETYQARTPSQYFGLLHTQTVNKIRTINQPGTRDDPFGDVVGYVEVGDKVVQIPDY